MSVKDYSTNANNNGSKPGINFAEGQVPSSLNDSARVVMADIAEWYAQINAGTVSGTVGGSGDALLLTTVPTVGAYATNQRYLVRAPGGNTVNNPTLNVSGLGVRTIVGPGGAVLAIPSYQTGDMLLLAYDGTNFRLVSAPIPAVLPGAATVTEVLTGTDGQKTVTSDALAGLWQRGTDIASSATLTLPTTGGGTFNVTGTTTVTGISAAQGGRCVKLRFDGSLTLTHNATTFILPGGGNIQTAAGDCAEFVNEAVTDVSGSSWRCVSYVAGSVAPRELQPLTLGTVQATTSGTSKDFTIPSWARRVRMVLNNVSLSGSALIRFRLGTSGGVVTTGYTSTGSTIGNGAATVNGPTSGFDIYNNGPSTGWFYHGSVDFTLVELATNTWVVSGVLAGTGGTATFTLGGSISLASALTTLRITSSNGTDTFDSGSVNVIYD